MFFQVLFYSYGPVKFLIFSKNKNTDKAKTINALGAPKKLPHSFV